MMTVERGSTSTNCRPSVALPVYLLLPTPRLYDEGRSLAVIVSATACLYLLIDYQLRNGRGSKLIDKQRLFVLDLTRNRERPLRKR
jgi:hypothetical protein